MAIILIGEMLKPRFFSLQVFWRKSKRKILSGRGAAAQMRKQMASHSPLAAVSSLLEKRLENYIIYVCVFYKNRRKQLLD